MLNCREVTERASDHLDHALPLWEGMRMRLHLAMCRHCRRYLRQLRVTIATARHLPGLPVPNKIVDSLVRRFRKQGKGS